MNCKEYEKHQLKDVDIDLSEVISRHSADTCIAYKEVKGVPIYLGYYFPVNYENDKKYPTILFIHGGGWENHKVFDEQSHWQGDHLGYLARYYAEKGFVCVSIDYRLAKENGQLKNYEIIDCYDDCCDAVDYILAHAKEYGVNPDDMYLLGESAGGHLAGAVATFSDDRRYSFKKVFLINPITNMFDEKWNKKIAKESAHSKLSLLDEQQCATYLSPLYQLDDSIGEVVLIHGEKDQTVSPEHSRKFYDRMRELSRPCTLHIIEDTNHAFLLAEYTKQLTACKMAIDIINRHLCSCQL